MKYPLALASAIFFWMPVTYALLLVFPYSGPFMLTAVPTATSIISIAGVLLILSGIFTKPVQRYLIVPIILDLLAVFGLGVFLLLTGEGAIPGSTPEPGWTAWAAGILLLAPCSLGVFSVVPAHPRVRSVSIALTAVMCVPAAVALVLLIMDYPYGTFESALGPMAFYWILCMPIIGACYLAMAWYAKAGDGLPNFSTGVPRE
jgi:hypothetical protein